MTGSVVVDFIVDTAGNVRDAYAVDATLPEFEETAVEAVSKWRFRPGKKDGHLVNCHMQLPIDFELDSG